MVISSAFTGHGGGRGIKNHKHKTHVYNMHSVCITFFDAIYYLEERMI